MKDLKLIFIILLCLFPYSIFSKAVVSNDAAAFSFFKEVPKPTYNLKLKPFAKKHIAKPKIKENKKWAALFFAIFVGMLGGHRLYLGTKPWVPALYLFTFGGGFLLLPLIDFFVLLFAKDIQPYLDNPNFFMWIK